MRDKTRTQIRRRPIVRPLDGVEVAVRGPSPGERGGKKKRRTSCDPRRRRTRARPSRGPSPGLRALAKARGGSVSAAAKQANAHGAAFFEVCKILHTLAQWVNSSGNHEKRPFRAPFWRETMHRRKVNRTASTRRGLEKGGQAGNRLTTAKRGAPRGEGIAR